MEIVINASFIMSLIVEILINKSLLICYIKTFLPRDLKEAGTREVVFWNMFQRILVGKAHYPTQSYVIDENTLLISWLVLILIMWTFSEYWWTDKHTFSILKNKISAWLMKRESSRITIVAHYRVLHGQAQRNLLPSLS